ncbi:hypothetical protein ACIQ6R_13140 [Streptomyces sp. NPDC096048]|uniref:hypothetical protein n=1 Tax=Streptomyces sp. NPDC096048 TaxID=3366072 RepID=UPI003824E2AF
MTTSPAPDRVTALYDAIDAFQRQHRTVGGLQHAQIRALLAEHLDAVLPATTDQTAELIAEEARTLADDLGLQLYRAQDAVAFVGECCTIAEREQRAITTADVREWLKGARCGRQLAADAELRRVADEVQSTETDEQRADREETERDHARGDHTHCGLTCEVELPTEHLRNFVIAKGYPGTKGALAELERRAAAKVAPDADLPARLEATLTERYTELGNPGSEMRRREQGPDGWPASYPVGPRHVAEVLRELLAAEARQDGAQR